ncbi:MAG: tRNA 2-thiouridine(34) synthase MnmA [Acholeplasmatales bacterium]|nr:MAG: tRNA 2-thiouridine(34) synthase MnmA [Acholeplasmatales bacterium]
MKKRVVLGMSGGVDSSVAAIELLEAGYDVMGVFMRNWDSTLNQDVLGNPDRDAPICSQERDYQDALQVCEHLGIPLHRVDFIEEYWRDVFTYFLREYEAGRTPNPDIMCNKYIKFAAFARHVEQFAPDYIAMGHYARVAHKPEVMLLRGADDNKDQTYFLSQLTQVQLEKVLFPIGHMQKADVRKKADAAGLPTADKKDSTGICFIGEREFSAFLDNYLPAKPGPIITLEGETIGRHTGLMHYTIGQRKGLGIGGLDGYGPEPWFVIGKSLPDNTLTVGQGFHHPQLYADMCRLEAVNVIGLDIQLDGLVCTAKVRYRQQDIPVRVSVQEGVVVVHFNRPVRAVTPGQSCVLYDQERCLGGGIIQAVYRHGNRLPY